MWQIVKKEKNEIKKSKYFTVKTDSAFSSVQSAVIFGTYNSSYAEEGCDKKKKKRPHYSPASVPHSSLKLKLEQLLTEPSLFPAARHVSLVPVTFL